jgi:probable phosphoglycerate mutase
VGTARQRLLPTERASLLLLIRHAHTSAVGTSLSGRTDNVPLSEHGRQQLVALCQALRGVRIDAVYSSPLERARATAQAVADERELTINLRDELLEIPGGEHATAIVARATRALEAIARGHPGETVAAITHAEVIRSAVLHYQRRSLDLYHEIDVPPASITEVRLSAKGAEVLSVGRSSA